MFELYLKDHAIIKLLFNVILTYFYYYSLKISLVMDGIRCLAAFSQHPSSCISHQ